jgi:NAD(P)-dependent dehydrogenase (short-subunit alcohol dehydrogenase family)
MPGRLQNKVAVITGGGGGIGRAAAHLFAAEGARVVLVDANEPAVRAVREEITSRGGTAKFTAADVTRAAEVQAMIAFAEGEFGALHVLFNNAGIFPDADGSVVDTDEAVFDQVIAVNLKGVFLGCKYGVPALLRAGGGSIINTASFVAVMGAATSQSAYTASKGFVPMRCVRGRSIHPCSRAYCPILPLVHAASCICRWDGWRRPRRWPRPRSSWLRTNRPTSTARRSSSTVVRRLPT